MRLLSVSVAMFLMVLCVSAAWAQAPDAATAPAATDAAPVTPEAAALETAKTQSPKSRRKSIRMIALKK